MEQLGRQELLEQLGQLQQLVLLVQPKQQELGLEHQLVEQLVLELELKPQYLFQ